MIRTRIESNRIEVRSINYTKGMNVVLDEEIKKNFIGSTISGYKVIDAKLLNKGLSYPSLKKGVIAEVDVVIELKVLTMPVYCILPRCKYVGNVNVANSDQEIFRFSVVNPDVPDLYLDSLAVLVSKNGASADSVKMLQNLEIDDEIPLFVISSTINPKDMIIKGLAITNFDDMYTPVFKFNTDSAKLVRSFSDSDIDINVPYVIKNKKLVAAPNKSNVQPIDFLKNEELYDYITHLISL